MHLRAEGQGKLLTLVLTPGQQHESTVLEQLLDQGAVKRVGRGRPKLRPDRLVGDKGYTGRRLRQAVRRRGIQVTIPHQRTERHRGPFDRAAYRLRNRIERLVNLVLIATFLSFEAGRLRTALRMTFGARGTHPLPVQVPAPPSLWAAAYAKMAAEAGLAPELSAGYEQTQVFLDPILSGAVTDNASWDSSRQRW